MRALFLIAAAAACSPSVWSADVLSRGDRDYALSQLHSSRKMFLDSVVGLTEAQWNFKAAPDRWSAAECAEHIAISEEYIGGMIQKMVDAPAQPDKKIPTAEARGKDEKLVAMVIDRSQKVQAPEPIRPNHRFKTPQEAVEHFKIARDKNIDYVDNTQDELRVRFAPHPLLGPLDLYQWYLLLAAHSQRHTLQLLEVKADPGFPKS